VLLRRQRHEAFLTRPAVNRCVVVGDAQLGIELLERPSTARKGIRTTPLDSRTQVRLCRDATTPGILQPYCNRAGTGTDAVDKSIPQKPVNRINKPNPRTA